LLSIPPTLSISNLHVTYLMQSLHPILFYSFELSILDLSLSYYCLLYVVLMPKYPSLIPISLCLEIFFSLHSPLSISNSYLLILINASFYIINLLLSSSISTHHPTI
jgi:hypothetical protein